MGIKRTHLNSGDKVLNGRYEVLKCIHSKGMANVYIVQDVNLGKQWCLKEIRKSEAGKKNIEYISLLQEANILRTLSHERIPRIVAIDDEGDSLFVVMDFLDGVTLKDYVASNGKVPEKQAVKWMIQIVQTMAYLHSTNNKKAIFYRDMKPDNLMIRPNGIMNIFDFGISIRIIKDGQKPEYSLGTKGYAAPEQKDKSLPIDLRSDIYSMGKTFYYMLTGIDPRSFNEDELKSISVWSPEITSSLVDVVEKCYSANVEDRYETCEDLIYALENYITADKNYRGKSKRKVAVSLITLLLGIGISVGSIIPFSIQDDIDAQNYEKAIEIANQSGRIEDYDYAIGLNPNNADQYIGYIEAIKSDGVFSLDEEKKLLNFINPVLSSIKSDKSYGNLAYEIGKLYWFFYEDESAGKTVSIKWFEDAKEKGYNKDEAEVYHSLGVFNRDISKSIREANDSGMYKEYWDNLMKIQETDTSDIVTLQKYISIAECISTYVYNLKKDGVSFEEVSNEINELNTFITNYKITDSTVDVIVSLYNELSDILSNLDNRVKVVYKVD